MKYTRKNFNREVKEYQAQTLRDLSELKTKGGESFNLASVLERTYRKRTQFDWCLSFLNNFHCRLPGKRNLRYSAQTLQEKIFSDIDQTIQQMGLTSEETAQLDVKTTFGSEVLINIYIQMRRLGYNHYPDLVR